MIAGDRRSSSVLVTRLVGAAAALVAAVCAVVGSFLPLVSGSLGLRGSAALTVSVTGWQATSNARSGDSVSALGSAPQNGIPLTIAAALLLIVTLLILMAAPRSAPAVLRLAALVGSAVAAAFFVGVLLTLGVQLADLLSSISGAGSGASSSLGAGFWLVLVAGLLSIAAVVLTVLPARPAPAQAPAAPPPVGDSPERKR